MIRGICDRCGKESKEFFSYQGEEDRCPVVTFLQNEAPWQVDFAKPDQFILVEFPGESKKGKDREADWKMMCPRCIEEFWRWFKAAKDR